MIRGRVCAALLLFMLVACTRQSERLSMTEPNSLPASAQPVATDPNNLPRPKASEQAAITSLAAEESKAAATDENAQPADAAIRAAIIRQSIANYYGYCPCPYNLDPKGRTCGLRSAYNRLGDASPLCYASDVSDEMVHAYQHSHGGT
jgi:hypothetical protein